MDYPLYLASQSPRRKELLNSAGLRFQVRVPKKEELPAPKTIQKMTPQQIVRTIALAKGQACAEELIGEKIGNALILSADTLVFLGGKVLGKPRSEEEAKKMLRALSGKWHEVFTGVAVLKIEENCLNLKKITHVRTKVKFFPLSKEKINWYVATKEPMDKAGSYGAQGFGARFVEKYSGSYTNVVGLPLGESLELLEKIPGFIYE